MRTDPAVRRFEFPTGRRVMTDVIVAENGTLVDRLGPVTLRIPPRLAPAPVLGRLYEYSGSFRYSVDNGGETS